MAWDTADVVSSIISGVALLVSGGSYLYTNHKSDRSKKYQYKLDQWHYCRDDIEAKANHLETTASKLSKVTVGINGVKEACFALRQVHKELIGNQLLLSRALIKAGKSAHTSEKIAWSDLAYQPMYDDNTNIDYIGELLNGRLSDAATLDDVESLANDILAVWLLTLDEIQSALRQETNTFDPNFQSHLLG